MAKSHFSKLLKIQHAQIFLLGTVMLGSSSSQILDVLNQSFASVHEALRLAERSVGASFGALVKESNDMLHQSKQTQLSNESHFNSSLAAMRHQLKNAANHNSNLENKIECQEEELIKLRQNKGMEAEMNNLQREVQSKDARIVELESTVQHLRCETKTKQASLDEANEKITNVWRFVVQKDKQIQELMNKNAEMKSKQSSQDEKLAFVKNQLTLLSSNAQDATEDFQNKQKKLLLQISTLESEKKVMHQKIKNLTPLRTLQEQVDVEVRKKLKSSKESQAKLALELCQLQKFKKRSLQQAKGRIANKRRKVNHTLSQQAVIDSLKSQISDLETVNQELKLENTEYASELNKLLDSSKN